MHERLAIQEWMQEEWYVLETAFAEIRNDDEELVDYDTIYQLEERREYLLRLCVRCIRKMPLEPEYTLVDLGSQKAT